jgi:hypothetical protein
MYIYMVLTYLHWIYKAHGASFRKLLILHKTATPFWGGDSSGDMVTVGVQRTVWSPPTLATARD